MSNAEIKQKVNASTKRSCLPDAKEVAVRHCTEEVFVEGRSPWGGTCFLIHSDVTVSKFFA